MEVGVGLRYARAAVSPALPVRPSTSSTPEVMNIELVTRDSETVTTKLR